MSHSARSPKKKRRPTLTPTEKQVRDLLVQAGPSGCTSSFIATRLYTLAGECELNLVTQWIHRLRRRWGLSIQAVRRSPGLTIYRLQSLRDSSR